MWIITKFSGVINTKTVTRFIENSFGTHAQIGTASYLISEKQVLTTIIDALKNGEHFLEVE